jgi:hypothetical protein
MYEHLLFMINLFMYSWYVYNAYNNFKFFNYLSVTQFKWTSCKHLQLIN